MKNSHILISGLVGLLLGMILMTGFNRTSFGNEYKDRFVSSSTDYPNQMNGMMHTMGDGQMMMNSQMDMSRMMNSMMVGLQGKTGDDFDKAFLSEMIVHHQGAVAMADQVLKTSKRPELIKLANDIITAQNGEIKMMQNWQKEWYSKN